MYFRQEAFTATHNRLNKTKIYHCSMGDRNEPAGGTKERQTPKSSVYWGLASSSSALQLQYGQPLLASFSGNMSEANGAVVLTKTQQEEDSQTYPTGSLPELQISTQFLGDPAHCTSIAPPLPALQTDAVQPVVRHTVSNGTHNTAHESINSKNEMLRSNARNPAAHQVRFETLPLRVDQKSRESPSVGYAGRDSLEYYQLNAVSWGELDREPSSFDYYQDNLSNSELNEDEQRSTGYTTELESAVSDTSASLMDRRDVRPIALPDFSGRFNVSDTAPQSVFPDAPFIDDSRLGSTDSFQFDARPSRSSSVNSIRRQYLAGEVGTSTMEELFPYAQTELIKSRRWPFYIPFVYAAVLVDGSDTLSPTLARQPFGDTLTRRTLFLIMGSALMHHVLFSVFSATGIPVVSFIFIVSFYNTRDVNISVVEDAASYALGSSLSYVIFGLGLYLSVGMDVYWGTQKQGVNSSTHPYWKHMMKSCCVALWFFWSLFALLALADQFWNIPAKWFFSALRSEKIVQEAMRAALIQSFGIFGSYFFETFHRFLNYHSLFYPQMFISFTSFVLYSVSLTYYVARRPAFPYSIALAASVLYVAMSIFRAFALLGYLVFRKYELGWQSGMRVRLFQRERLKLRRRKRGLQHAVEGDEKTQDKTNDQIEWGNVDHKMSFENYSSSSHESVSEPQRRQRRMPTGRPNNVPQDVLQRAVSPAMLKEVRSKSFPLKRRLFLTDNVGHTNDNFTSVSDPRVFPTGATHKPASVPECVATGESEIPRELANIMRAATVSLSTLFAQRLKRFPPTKSSTPKNSLESGSTQKNLLVQCSGLDPGLTLSQKNEVPPDVPPVQRPTSSARRIFRSGYQRKSTTSSRYLSNESEEHGSVAVQQPLPDVVYSEAQLDASNRSELLSRSNLNSRSKQQQCNAKAFRGRKKQRHTTVVSVKSVPVHNALLLDAFCLPTIRSCSHFWTRELPRQLSETWAYVQAAVPVAVPMAAESLGFQLVILVGSLTSNVQHFVIVAVLVAFINVVNSSALAFAASVKRDTSLTPSLDWQKKRRVTLEVRRSS